MIQKKLLCDGNMLVSVCWCYESC